jgi:cytochrome d ubiquinol oxidase subunit II
MDLNTIWFCLVGILLTGYAILDGFDLGVGSLHLLTKTDHDRRIMLNSIGPVWDGNEVWLITGGGALFAAFPHVYATVFSGFYTAFMLLLAVLIFRAVAIEFRSKQPSQRWRNTWDIAFSVSSIVIALLAGVALGNIALGIPIGPDKEFTGSFFGLLHPYAILVGITTISLFMMHGSIYAVMKTEGKLHETIRKWINKTIAFFIICYITLTSITLIFLPHMAQNFHRFPVFYLIPLLNALAIANIPREINKGRDWMAFVSSCCNITALMALFAIGLFPNIVYSSPAAANSLTIYNAASSEKTLKIMLTIALTGMPIVIAYTISIYYIFRGKVKLDQSSY